MNALEHLQTLKDSFDGVFVGEVESTADPELLDRVRVRVYGIYDSPIKSEHIPWAMCSDHTRAFSVGQVVAVMFLGGDHHHPIVI